MRTGDCACERTSRTHRGAIIQIIHRFQDICASTFRNILQEAANGGFRIRANVVHVFLHGLQPIVIHDFESQVRTSVCSKSLWNALCWMSWMPL